MVETDASSLFTLNAYDVFANILPGVVFLGGIYVPFADTENMIPELGLLQGLFLAFISFAIGMAFQNIGSKLFEYKLVNGIPPWTPRDRAFDDVIDKIQHRQNENGESESGELSPLEKKFGTKVQSDFDEITSDNSEIFKTVLSYIEASDWNRALRIQAQHLATRGIAIASLILFLVYLSIIFSTLVHLPFTIVNVPISISHSAALCALSILSFILFADRSIHFEKDVARYLMAEFYLDRTELGDS